MPALVLTDQEVLAEFPGLTIGLDESDYVDNEGAAEASIRPDDTGADLAAQGRITGFGSTYTVGAVLQISSIVELFDTPQSARGYLTSQLQDFPELEGTALGEGFILRGFEELAGPDVGSDSFAGRLIVTPPGVPLTSPSPTPLCPGTGEMSWRPLW